MQEVETDNNLSESYDEVMQLSFDNLFIPFIAIRVIIVEFIELFLS